MTRLCWSRRAVSYTHLDVYKRQGYVSPDAHGHGVGGTEKYYYQAGTSQMSLSEVSFVPVSYTHLDMCNDEETLLREAVFRVQLEDRPRRSGAGNGDMEEER